MTDAAPATGRPPVIVSASRPIWRLGAIAAIAGVLAVSFAVASGGTEIPEERLLEVPAASDHTLTWELPEGWVAVVVGVDSGASRYPEDPALAASVDLGLARATERGSLAYAIAPSGPAPAEFLVDFHALDGPDAVADAIERGRDTFTSADGVELLDDGEIDLGGTDGHRFRYAVSGSPPQSSFQLIVPARGGIFVITGQSADAATIDELLEHAGDILLV